MQKHPESPNRHLYIKDQFSKCVIEAKFLRGHSHAAAGSSGCVLRWHRRCLELCVVGHHPVETDANAFDDGEQNGARYRAVAHRLVASSYSERATREESCDDGIPRVLLLPYALHGAVVCVEKTTPDTEVAAEYGCASLYRCDGTDAPFAVGRVAELEQSQNLRTHRTRSLGWHTPLIPCQTAPPTACDVTLAKKSERRWSAYPHGECASEVIEDDPGAGISGVVHRDLCEMK